MILAKPFWPPALPCGEKAPEFTAVDQDGQTVRLADFRGNIGVVLFFYPKDESPICTKEACSFRDSYEKFLEAGAEVLGVSADSPQSHRQFVERLQLPFRLLSDPKGELRKAFGVAKTLGLLPGRATYVIDKEGVVQLSFAAQFASERHVEEALQALS